MITLQQAQIGLVRYIESDVMPHLDGMKKVGLGIYAGLAGNNISTLISKYAHHPAVEVMGIIDDAGNIDLDAVYQAALPLFSNGQRVPINIPLIGTLTVDKTDLDKLYQYMKG